MAIIDDIVSILRGANPDADPQSLQAQAEQMAASPNAASVMSRITGAATGLASPVASMLGNAAIGAGDVVNNAISAVVPPVASASSTPPSTPTMPPPAPAAAPTVLPPKPAVSAPVEAPAKPEAPPTSMLPTDSNDNAKRQAMLEAASHKAKMAAIPAAIAGVGGAIGNAAQAFGVRPEQGAEERILNRAHTEEEGAKADIEKKISNDPNSEASKSAREVVLQIAPQMAQQPGFNVMSDADIRNKLPLIDTMMKAKAAEDAKKVGLEQAKSNRELSLGLREDQQQDRLEQQAMQRIATLRGDQSLARAEEQRDAATVAYNRLNEVKNTGKGLNPVDYVDILGQIYKARTGRAPGDQVLKDIHQATAEGQLGKAYTYATGNQAPATSTDIMNSLMNMAHSMGTQADQFHDNYMKAHMMKPSGLEDSRWKPIMDTGRGISFADATKTAKQEQGSMNTTRKSAGGYNYTVGE